MTKPAIRPAVATEWRTAAAIAAGILDNSDLRDLRKAS